MLERVVMEVEVRGCLFEIEAVVDVSEGGSDSYGSDEPYWLDVEVQDILNPRREKSISDRLREKIIGLYEENIVDKFL
tara:strand:- start:371 stop:604 length:234 start_codon:yes stop_codon:yes gene_type:complete